MVESSPTRSRDEVLKDFRTAAILEAARRVIGEVGFAEASMERIAAEAGVAKGTLYLYFAGKQELVRLTLDYGVGELVERSREAVGRHVGTAERLRALLDTMVQRTGENRAFVQAVMHHPPSADEEGDTPSRRMDAYLEFVTELIGEGIERGELRAVDPRVCASHLVNASFGVLVERIQQDAPMPDDEELEAMLDLFLHGAAAGGNA